MNQTVLAAAGLCFLAALLLRCWFLRRLDSQVSASVRCPADSIRSWNIRAAYRDSVASLIFTAIAVALGLLLALPDTGVANALAIACVGFAFQSMLYGIGLRHPILGMGMQSRRGTTSPLSGSPGQSVVTLVENDEGTEPAFMLYPERLGHRPVLWNVKESIGEFIFRPSLGPLSDLTGTADSFEGRGSERREIHVVSFLGQWTTDRTPLLRVPRSGGAPDQLGPQDRVFRLIVVPPETSSISETALLHQDLERFRTEFAHLLEGARSIPALLATDVENGQDSKVSSHEASVQVKVLRPRTAAHYLDLMTTMGDWMLISQGSRRLVYQSTYVEVGPVSSKDLDESAMSRVFDSYTVNGRTIARYLPRMSTDTALVGKDLRFLSLYCDAESGGPSDLKHLDEYMANVARPTIEVAG